MHLLHMHPKKLSCYTKFHYSAAENPLIPNVILKSTHMVVWFLGFLISLNFWNASYSTVPYRALTPLPLHQKQTRFVS